MRQRLDLIESAMSHAQVRQPLSSIETCQQGPAWQHDVLGLDRRRRHCRCLRPGHPGWVAPRSSGHLDVVAWVVELAGYQVALRDAGRVTALR